MSWEIKAIDFDNTKEGVLELLNEQAFRMPHREVVRVIHPPTSVTPIEDQEALEDARLLADDVDRLSTENSDLRKRIQDLEGVTRLIVVSVLINSGQVPLSEVLVMAYHDLMIV